MVHLEILKRRVTFLMSLHWTIEKYYNNGIIFVRVKELPGCLVEADTDSEAMSMIKEAMELWFEDAIENNIEIPKPIQIKSKTRWEKFKYALISKSKNFFGKHT